ncbi:hypothetical protein BN871_EA_00010, partial [Paenibacillus sp. P22]
KETVDVLNALILIIGNEKEAVEQILQLRDVIFRRFVAVEGNEEVQSLTPDVPVE